MRDKVRADGTRPWRPEKDPEKLKIFRERRLSGIEEIEALPTFGYTVRQLSRSHFRVNEALDLYPTGRRFHCLRTDERGDYERVQPVVEQYIEHDDSRT